ncbi:hypothetical protein [Pseudosulfitobacter sp. RP-4]
MADAEFVNAEGKEYRQWLTSPATQQDRHLSGDQPLHGILFGHAKGSSNL